MAKIELIERGKSEKMHQLPILFVSDTQFHNYLSGPNATNFALVDAIIPVSVRPPQANFFSKDLFTYLIEKYGPNNYVIHMGDALNVACKNEWKRFLWSIDPNFQGRRSHRGWLMVPGNHDFFFVGISDMGLTKKTWENACSNVYPPPKDIDVKEVIFSKDVFVKNYYNQLLKQGQKSPLDFPTRKETQCVPIKYDPEYNTTRSNMMMQCEWHSKNQTGFLQKLFFEYSITDRVEKSYRSSLVQQVNLSPGTFQNEKFVGILLDTSDYKLSPLMFLGALQPFKRRGAYNAGINGNITQKQFLLVNRWVEQIDPEAVVIYMGHHPYKDISRVGKERIKKLIEKRPSSFYFSSHTHTGFLSNEGPIKELNLGSVSDYPNEVMFLKWQQIKETLYLFPKRIRETFFDISDPKETFCLRSENYTKRGDEKYRYLAYKNWIRGAFDKTLNSILMSYHRVFLKFDIYNEKKSPLLDRFKLTIKKLKSCKSFIPKRKKRCLGEKINLIHRLEAVDQEIYQDSRMRHDRLRYGSCQTLWAAYAEFLKDKARVPYDL
jgi:hypothetical protein